MPAVKLRDIRFNLLCFIIVNKLLIVAFFAHREFWFFTIFPGSMDFSVVRNFSLYVPACIPVSKITAGIVNFPCILFRILYIIVPVPVYFLATKKMFMCKIQQSKNHENQTLLESRVIYGLWANSTLFRL